MKNYIKPIIEETLVVTNDILEGSGLNINNANADFNHPDEIL